MSLVDRKAHLLSWVDLLQGLSPQEISRLASRIPDLHLARNQMLYTPEHKAQVFFLVLEGRVRLYRVLQGNELTIRLVRQGEFFGEAAFAGRPQGVYAQALEPS
jgi:CRP-like cAMP-binding protein